MPHGLMKFHVLCWSMVLAFFSHSYTALYQPDTSKLNGSGSFYLQQTMRVYQEGDLDSARYFARLAWDGFSREGDTLNMINCNNALCNLNFRLGHDVMAREHAERSYRLARSFLGPTDPTYIATINNAAVMEQRMANYIKSIHLLKALMEPESIDNMNAEQRGIAHLNLAQNYNRIHDFNQAEIHFDQAETIFEAEDDFYEQRVFSRLSRGYMMFKKGHFEEAYTIMSEVLANMVDPVAFEHSYVQSKLQAMRITSRVLLGLERTEEAYELLLQATNYDTIVANEDVGLVHMYLGDCVLQMGQPEEALRHYYKAASHIHQADSSDHYEHAIAVKMRIGQAFQALGRFEQADSTYTTAINSVKMMNVGKNVYSNKGLVRDSWLLKARNLLEGWNTDVNRLQSALNCYEHAVWLQDEIYDDLLSMSAKRLTQQQIQDMYYESFDLALRLYDSLADQRYLDFAVIVADLSLNASFRDNVQGYQDMLERIASDTLFDQFISLQYDLHQYEVMQDQGKDFALEISKKRSELKNIEDKYKSISQKQKFQEAVAAFKSNKASGLYVFHRSPAYHIFYMNRVGGRIRRWMEK